MINVSHIRAALSALVVFLFLLGCTSTDPVSSADESGSSVNEQLTAGSTPITETESDDLVFLREEEKLARDVYLKMSQLWAQPIFATIASSEQRHMDAVLKLLDHYSITDPAKDKDEGEFTNLKIKALYDELIAKGELSLQDALEVGVIIEETDIQDITIFLTRTDQKNIEQVYEYLLNGSNNHLDSFEKLQERF